MKILVTGGAGFIGSNVADAYISAGHEVCIIDNLSSGKMKNVNPGAHFYHLDIRSDEVKRVFELEKPDVVNCHAAQISVPYSVKNPLVDADINIRGFLNILEASRAVGVQKVIFISSGGAVYGEAQEFPTSEDCPAHPISPYAIAKGVCEDYLSFYGSHYGINYSVLRYANVYGPRQIPESEAGVVSIFISSLLSGKHCSVYSYADEPEGMSRDYCFVGDVARANLFVLDKGDRETFNIGTGMATRTRELFRIIYANIKKNIPSLPALLENPQLLPNRPGDLRRSCLNIEKALCNLGWKPAVGLEDGIEHTIKWQIDHNC